MIKFYTGAQFVNQGDGIYFITPATGVPFIQTVVGGVQKKVAEVNNGYSTTEIDAIKKELNDAISANAGNITTVTNALNAIIAKHGSLLEKLEEKVDKNTQDISTNAGAIEDIVDGTTTVAKAANATNATNAEKATHDADGNVITSTYATKTALKETSDYVGNFGTIEGVTTVVDYINKKTENVANDATVQQIQQDLDKVEALFDADGKALQAVQADNATLATTAETANKTKGTLTVGEKTFDGSANVSVSAADLGLDNAVHFLGTSSSAITDGGSETPTITGWSGAVQAGDIVLYGNQEYIWSAAGKWEVFGNEGSYAIKTQKIEAGEGLTGGGDLSADREIAHAVPTGAGVDKSVTAATGKYLSGITFDKFGHVVAVSTADEKTYTGAKGIEVTTDGTVQHTNAVTAGTAQGSSGSIGFGESINIPTVTYDAQGHVTGSSTTTVTLPSDDRIVALENTLAWHSAETGVKLG